jgi:GNAT acetyltransferase-like protein
VGFSVTWHKRSSDIAGELWESCFGPPREGLFWFRALERAGLEGQFTFLFGLLLRDHSAVGIVPAFVFDVPLKLVIPPRVAGFVLPFARGPLRGLGYQRTFFIGNVAGEEGCIGLRAGISLSDVVGTIHAAARAKAAELAAPMLVWKDFGDQDRPALDSLVSSVNAFRIPSYPGTTIPLVRGGFEAYLTTQRSARRWKLKNKLRRGKTALEAEPSVVKSPGEAELTEIFALFWRTYLKGRTKFERLNIDFFRAIARCRESVFIVLRDSRSGKMIAFMLALDLGERVINRFIGIDYAAGRGGYLYFQLFAAAYDWAVTTGAKVMQSGQTGYRAKLDLGHELFPLWNYCCHRNRIINRVFAKVASGISWETLDDDLRGHLDAHRGERQDG